MERVFSFNSHAAGLSRSSWSTSHSAASASATSFHRKRKLPPSSEDHAPRFPPSFSPTPTTAPMSRKLMFKLSMGRTTQIDMIIKTPYSLLLLLPMMKIVADVVTAAGLLVVLAGGGGPSNHRRLPPNCMVSGGEKCWTNSQTAASNLLAGIGAGEGRRKREEKEEGFVKRVGLKCRLPSCRIKIRRNKCF